MRKTRGSNPLLTAKIILLILKTNDMNQLKRAQVIMLPTNQKSKSFTRNLVDTLYLNNEKKISTEQYIIQHLYIISDDEIKEGDWKYDFKLNIIIKHGSYIDGCKKIIATTNTSLNYIKHDDTVPYPKGEQVFLPQPSQQFIEKYIESYNKGEIIIDVLVEYENYEMNSIVNYRGNYDFKCPNCKNNIDDLMFSKQSTLCNQCDKLKINSKDNTITIKKLKYSWNKEEVVELLYKITADFEHSSRISGYIKEKTTSWINQNL